MSATAQKGAPIPAIAAVLERSPLRRVHTGERISIEVGDAQPLIPDAKYEAICTGYEVSEVFKTFRLFYHFRVAVGPYTGTMLFKPYLIKGHRLPGSGPGTGIRYRMHRRAAFFKMLCRVLELPPKTKAHLVWPNELVNQLCVIQTRTVTKDSRQQDLSERERYSVVDDVLGIAAGGEPRNQGTKNQGTKHHEP